MRMFSFRHYCILTEDYPAQYSIKNQFLKKEPLRREEPQKMPKPVKEPEKPPKEKPTPTPTPTPTPKPIIDPEC